MFRFVKVHLAHGPNLWKEDYYNNVSYFNVIIKTLFPLHYVLSFNKKKTINIISNYQW